MFTLVVDVPVVDALEDMFQDSFNFLSYLYKSYAGGRESQSRDYGGRAIGRGFSVLFLDMFI